MGFAERIRSSGVNDSRSTAACGCFNRCPNPLGFAFDPLTHHTIFDGALNVQRFRQGGVNDYYFDLRSAR